MSKLLLESKPCGRCGGSGSYSFNLMHGSRCYGCNGKGEVLTKRGRVAQDWLNKQRMVRITEFKVGDAYFSTGFNAGSYSEPNRWITVESIEVSESGRVTLRGVDKKREAFDKFARCSYEGPSDLLLRRAQTGEERAALYAAALAYQATLGKTGKPLKIKEAA
jgi:hypothetical protein